MPTLVEPTSAVHRSFLQAWDELGEDQERWMGARGLTREWTRDELEDPGVLWFVEQDQWLGRLAIRHELTPALLELGGHIGYVVRPSARRNGYATQMLVQSLPYAARLGIDPALVTCDADNEPSRKVIQAAGGELEDERHGKLRFWVATRTT
jgi:predicted acetyltransferase